jgi:superfamily II helicase
MKLETVMKLIKTNTNVFGFCNAKELSADIQDNMECKELRISIVRNPSCKVSNKEIFNNILVPLAKAKECLYKESLDTLYVFSRSLFRLRIIDRACSLLNSQMSETYNFTIVTNYDIITAEQEEMEIV